MRSGGAADDSEPTLTEPGAAGIWTDRRRLLVMAALGLAGSLTAGSDLVELSRLHQGAGGRQSAGPAATASATGRHRHARVARPAASPKAIEQWARPAFRLRDLHPDAPANAIALTIDDGPHPVYTPQMLDVLAEHGVKATFNMIGIQVERNPRLVRRVAEAGHTISNHSMTHPVPFNDLRPRRTSAELYDAWKAIADVTGSPPRLFRSPGGAWSKSILHRTAEYGMIPVDWDVDPRDWTRPGVRHITKSLLAGKAGDLLLCHDGGGDRSQTIKALHHVIPALQRRGLSFVPL